MTRFAWRLPAAALLAFAVASGPASAADTAQKAKTKEGAMKMDAKMDNKALIKSALGAAPEHIGKDAKVITFDADGKMVTLREGTNDFTCMADNPTSPGEDPMCLDKPGMQWAMSWMNKDAKPANTEPGLAYMLKGGSDISATDPWQTETKNFIDSPPHVMILWAFDAQKSGLPTKPQKTGMWIMWSGTPYAHLMVNGNPFEGKQITAR